MTEALAAETPVIDTPAEAPADAPSEPSDDVKPDVPANDEAKAEPEAEKPELSELDKYKYATQKRIDRQTAKLAELERQSREYAEKLSQYETSKKNEGPKESDFDSTEEYLLAKGAWNKEQEIAQKQAQERQEETQKAYAERMQKRSAEVSAQEAKFRAVTPDYDDATQVLNEYVADADKTSPGFTVFRDVLMSAPDLPALSYHLGKNPDLIESLMNKEPAQIAWVLIEEAIKLRDKPKDEYKQPPAPPKPVSGSSAPTKSIEQMSYKEIKKQWKL